MAFPTGVPQTGPVPCLPINWFCTIAYDQVVPLCTSV